MRVGILGISGRVGRLLVEATSAAGATLAGGTSRQPPSPGEAGRLFHDPAALAAGCDVAIDFTHPDAVPAHAAALAAAGIPWILGTTGLSASQQAAVADAARRIAVVQAANFSPGVTLVTDLARRLAAALPAAEFDAEILEMHHRQKRDAPSGTALALGHAVAGARGVPLEAVRESGRDGETGPRGDGAIGFAVLRGGQVVGEHTLLFTSDTEQIALTHRAFDRGVFAAGALRAAAWSLGAPPGLYDMDDVLGLRPPT